MIAADVATATLTYDWLACPECGGELCVDGAYVSCGACARKWPVVDGIPHFIADFPYWGEIPHRTMVQINRTAARGLWSSPLTETDDPVVREAAKMILNLDRANWQWLIDLPEASRVLDLGAGCGTNSHALALRFREVVAVEPVAERIEFMRQRFAQERLPGARLVRSTVWKLPFPPESFDLAVMNGVLEWIPQGRKEDPRELQLQSLRNLARLLRPGGYIYVGIENRYAAGQFIGYRDPHCGVPFVSVLPRPLAHWYARREGLSGGYRNYLYGRRGYRNLLREAGFEDLRCYVAMPSYNYPRYLVPLNRKLFSYWARTFQPEPRSAVRKAIRKFLLGTGLMAHLEYSFALVARKAPI
jgi:SAM-dependent methyltransferase